VDNADTGSILKSGPWVTSTSSSYRYGPDYNVNQEEGASVNGTNVWFEFQPVIPEDGWYNLDLFYNAHSTRGSVVRVVVNHGQGVTTNIVNMTVPGNAFTPVARHYFTNGVAKIRLLTIDIGSKYVIADAFWFFYRDENQPTFDWDADGLPDRFERYYFLDELAALPGDDPDNDGKTNLEEYQLGTDPTVTNPLEGSIMLIR